MDSDQVGLMHEKVRVDSPLHLTWGVKRTKALPKSLPHPNYIS